MKKRMERLILLSIVIIGVCVASLLLYLPHRNAKQLEKCQRQLVSIYHAKECCAVTGVIDWETETIETNSLLCYLRNDRMPSCPSGGIYDIGIWKALPLCSQHSVLQQSFLSEYKNRMREAQRKAYEEHKKYWKESGRNNMWYRSSRNKFFWHLNHEIPLGSSTNEVKAVLGDPQSDWIIGQERVWTYGVSRFVFYQFVFDETGKLKNKSQKNCNPRHKIKPLDHNDKKSFSTDNVASDIGVWRAHFGLYGQGSSCDRVDAGKKAFRHVTCGTKAEQIADIYGDVTHKTILDNDFALWTYRIGSSSFVQLIMSIREKEAFAAQEATYSHLTGDEERHTLCGKIEQQNSRVFDQAAWEATLPGYDMMHDRLGIGKKMMTHITAGMTRTELYKMMSKPTEVPKRSESVIYYGVYPDCLIKIRLNEQDKVSDVEYIGS